MLHTAFTNLRRMFGFSTAAVAKRRPPTRSNHARHNAIGPALEPLEGRLLLWVGPSVATDVIGAGLMNQYENMVVGDFDNDNNDDLLLHHVASGSNRVAWGTGDGRFRVEDDLMARGAVNGFDQVVVGDFNRDGYDDMFFRHIASGSNRLITWGPNRRPANTITNTLGPGSVNNYEHMIMGDFDADGNKDLVFHHIASGSNRLGWGTGDGRFRIEDDLMARGAVNGFDQVVVGDFNRDGYDDMFFRHIASGSNRLITWGPNRRPTETVTHMLGQGAVNGYSRMAAGDFDGDGWNDVHFHHASGENRLAWSEGKYRFVMLEHPLGRGTVNGYDQMVVGDFNRDGRDDLFFRHIATGGNRLVLSGKGAPCLLLGASLTANWNDGVIYVDGSPADDVIEARPGLGRALVVLDGSGKVTPVCSDSLRSYDFNRVALEIRAHGGNDYVRNDTSSPSTIYGGTGDDIIFGGNAADVIDSGEGNDRVDAGPGNDVLIGRYGVDHLNGGDGIDLLRVSLYGTPDHDRIIVRNFGDRIVLYLGLTESGESSDREVASFTAMHLESFSLEINGADGNDYIRNDTSIPSTIRGGAGHDTTFGGSAADHIHGERGNDWIDGNSGDDELAGGDGDDHLNGGDGNDILRGDAGNDELTGRNGDDVYVFENSLRILEFDRVLEQGTSNADGNDTLDFRRVNESVWVNLSSNQTIASHGSRYVQGVGENFERVFGGSAADVLIGSDEADWFYGGPGNDFFDGRAGYDTVDYSDSPETVRWFHNSRFTFGDGVETLLNVENAPGTKRIEAQLPRPTQGHESLAIFVNGGGGCCNPYLVKQFADRIGITTVEANWNDIDTVKDPAPSILKASRSQNLEFVSDLLAILRMYQDSDTIILIGHSLGGDALLDAVVNTHREVDLLAVLDPVDWDGTRSGLEDRVNGNVKYFYNRWQMNHGWPSDFEVPGDIESHASRSLWKDFGIPDQAEHSEQRNRDGSVAERACDGFDYALQICRHLFVPPLYLPIPIDTRTSAIRHADMPYDEWIQIELNTIISGMQRMVRPRMNVATELASFNVASADGLVVDHSRPLESADAHAAVDCSLIDSIIPSDANAAASAERDAAYDHNATNLGGTPSDETQPATSPETDLWSEVLIGADLWSVT